MANPSAFLEMRYHKVRKAICVNTWMSTHLQVVRDECSAPLPHMKPFISLSTLSGYSSPKAMPKQTGHFRRLSLIPIADYLPAIVFQAF